MLGPGWRTATPPRRPRRGRADAGLLLVALAALSLGPARPAAAQPAPIVLYGDSVATESKVVLAAELDLANPGAPVIVRTYPGTALCDWMGPQMAEDAESSPGLVVILFVGTPNRPCVEARGDSPAAWASDLAAVTAFWLQRGTRVLLVGPPGGVSGVPAAPVAATGPDWPTRTIAATEAAIASGGNPMVRYVDAGTPFLGPDGRYAMYLPCLPGEGAAQGCGVPPAPPGEIQVRNADGDHFCVLGGLGATEACPVYSSGVQRLAEVVAAATEDWTLPSGAATPEEAAVNAQLDSLVLSMWASALP